MKHFVEYMHPHPDLKLRMALYNYYLKRFKNIKNKEEVARYCSKYDIDKIMAARERANGN